MMTDAQHAPASMQSAREKLEEISLQRQAKIDKLSSQLLQLGASGHLYTRETQLLQDGSMKVGYREVQEEKARQFRQDTGVQLMQLMNTAAAETVKAAVNTTKESKATPDGLKKCKTKPKSASTAILLQVFVGATGAAYAYLHQWILFGVALGIWIIACCAQCIIGCTSKPDHKDSEHATRRDDLNCTATFLNCVICGLWLYGVFAIVTRSLADGEGCELG